MQLLVVTATAAMLTLVVKPEFEAPDPAEQARAAQIKLAEALEYVGESKRRIGQSFTDSHSLPRTATEANAMKPATDQMPEFVQDVKFQHDYAGETVMIMVYLKHGVVDNVLGGEQYVYIAGIKSQDDAQTIEWQCGARNVDRTLLPENCRS